MAAFTSLFGNGTPGKAGGWTSQPDSSAILAYSGLASQSTLAADRGGFADLVGWEECQRRRSDLKDLASRCLEPNVFLEPDFALSLAQHSPPSHRPKFLLISESLDGGGARLIGVVPLHPVGKRFGTLIKGWMPKMVAAGTPLFDRHRARTALNILLAWLAGNCVNAAGLLLKNLPSDGPTARLIRNRARATGLVTREFGAHSRAILSAGVDCEAVWREAIGKKHAKELRRQHRRLSEAGQLEWRSARTPAEIRVAFEQFLTLESRGWKGARRTALLCNPALATFGRSMSRLMAQGGNCQIDCLAIDDRPIAMGVSLLSGDKAALWKIAYDEEFASLSPGVHFVMEFSRRQALRSDVLATDSCASANHPMIDRLWPERMPVSDVCIAVSRDRLEAFKSAADGEERRRRTREFLKFAYAKSRTAVTKGALLRRSVTISAN